MTKIKTAFAVAALAFGLSTSMAAAHTAKVPPHPNAAQAQAFDWAAPAPVNASIDNNAYRYHGGPKSND
jgi:hypothetical protein